MEPEPVRPAAGRRSVTSGTSAALRLASIASASLQARPEEQIRLALELPAESGAVVAMRDKLFALPLDLVLSDRGPALLPEAAQPTNQGGGGVVDAVAPPTMREAGTVPTIEPSSRWAAASSGNEQQGESRQ